MFIIIIIVQLAVLLHTRERERESPPSIQRDSPPSMQRESPPSMQCDSQHRREYVALHRWPPAHPPMGPSGISVANGCDISIEYS